VFRFRLASPLTLEPCAVFEMGGVTGVGSDLPTSHTRTKQWAAAELGLRADLRLGEWLLTLDAGLAAPLTRYRFVFQNPDTSIHQVPTWSVTSALRIGRAF